MAARYAWPPKRNEPRPSLDGRWQAELDRVFGLSPTGLSIVRLVWMPEVREYLYEAEQLRYTCGRVERFVGWGEPEYDAAGKVVGYHVHPPTAEPPAAEVTGGRPVVPLQEVERIAPPRWALEQWVGPEIARRGWSARRWQWLYDSRMGITRKVDVWGPPPTQGYYLEAFHLISTHQAGKACCKERQLQGYQCYGEYREPSDADVEYARFLKRQMDQQAALYGYDEAPPAHVLAQAYRDRVYEIEQQEERADAALRQRLRDALSPHSKRISSEGHGLDKFKYTDIGPTVAKLREQATAPAEQEPR